MDFKELTPYPGMDLSRAVEALLLCKEEGIKAKLTFRGVTLYSTTVTMESAYLEIVGKTKEEHEKELNDAADNYTKLRAEYEEKVPELVEFWREKGKEFIDPEMITEWNELLPAALKGPYMDYIINCASSILEMLQGNVDFSECEKELMRQAHSGTSYALTMSMVRKFHKTGPELIEYLKSEHLDTSED